MSMGTGAAELWMTPALPYLKNTKFKFPVSTDELSWIISLFNVGEIIGFLLYPLIIDRIGRKNTLLAFFLPQILSCTLILIAQNVITLFSARIIGGIGYGAGTVVQIIYVNEIADKNIRGLLISISRLAFLIGCISIILVGSFTSYDMMNLVVLLLQPIFILTFFFVPESPYFYLKCHREEEALKSLSKLRGIEDIKILDIEINKMKEDIIEDGKSKNFALRNLFENKRHRKAFFIVATIKIGVAFSGSSVIAVYTQEIFSYTGFFIPPEYSMIILVTIVSIGVVPIVLLVDYVGRRVMILYGSIVCSLSLTVLGLFFFLKIYLHINGLSSISWSPLVALIFLELASVALLCTSFVISGEIFSSQVKSTALSFLYIKTKLLEVLIKLSFENVVGVFQIYGVFWIYAAACFLLCLTGFYITPETKGKTLEEIQILLD